MTDTEDETTEQDEPIEVTATFENGQAKMIRTDLRLIGSDAVFEVDGRTAEFAAGVPDAPLEETKEAVIALPFIDDVDMEGTGYDE